jgi:hypothetical protein
MKCGRTTVRYIVHVHGRNDSFVMMCPACQTTIGDAQPWPPIHRAQPPRSTWQAWRDHVDDSLIPNENRTVAYYAREAAREVAYYQQMRDREQRELRRREEERDIRAALRMALYNAYRDPPTVFGERRKWPPSVHVAGFEAIVPITQIPEIGGVR